MNMYLTEKDNDGWRKNKWEKNLKTWQITE